MIDESLSQILALIHTSHKQLHKVKLRAASLRQIASCVCTAKEELQRVEEQLNELHQDTGVAETTEEQLQSMVMWKKQHQRTREIGEAAKELWQMDAQRTQKLLDTVNARLMKASRELRSLGTVSSQQMVDEGDDKMRQWHANCQHALMVLNAVKRRLRKEKSWLRILRRRIDGTDDRHEVKKYKDNILRRTHDNLRS